MSWTTGQLEFDFWQRKEFTLLCTAPRPAVWRRHSRSGRCAPRTGAVSVVIKRLEQEADHSSVSSKGKVVPVLNELSTEYEDV
jgi:hypothetical protein